MLCSRFSPEVCHARTQFEKWDSAYPYLIWNFGCLLKLVKALLYCHRLQKPQNRAQLPCIPQMLLWACCQHCEAYRYRLISDKVEADCQELVCIVKPVNRSVKLRFTSFTARKALSKPPAKPAAASRWFHRSAGFRALFNATFAVIKPDATCQSSLCSAEKQTATPLLRL